MTQDSRIAEHPPSPACKRLLHGLEGKNAVVMHPDDADAATVLRELRRAGMVARLVWPPPARLPNDMDILLCILDSDVRSLLRSDGGANLPPIVGIADGRSPETPVAVRDNTATVLLFKPVSPEQVVLSAFAARQAHQYQTRLLRRIDKLDETLRSIREVERAKVLLMQSRQIGEHEAYHFMRRRAMEKRVPISRVASTIIDASEILE